MLEVQAFSKGKHRGLFALGSGGAPWALVPWQLTDFGLSTTGLITTTAPLSSDGHPGAGAPDDASELPSPLPSSIGSIFREGPNENEEQPGPIPLPAGPGGLRAGPGSAMESGEGSRASAGGEAQAGSKNGAPERGAAGTPDYLAPELLLGTGNHGETRDGRGVCLGTCAGHGSYPPRSLRFQVEVPWL